MYSCYDSEIEYRCNISSGKYVIICNGQHNSSIPPETSGTIHIPSKCTINGKEYPVKSLYPYSFYQTQISSVILPPTIESIVGPVFENNPNLVFVDLSKTKVKVLMAYCFYYCTKLETVYLNDQITDIEARVFYVCESLKCLALPPKIKTIADTAFLSSPLLQTFIYCGKYDLQIPVNMNATKIYVSTHYRGDTFSGTPVTKMTNLCYEKVITLVKNKESKTYIYISTLFVSAANVI